MTEPTLADRLAEVLPCECGARTSHGYEDLHEEDCRSIDYPAVLTLIHTLLREERERCEEVAMRRVAPDSPEHVAADCTVCHDGLMMARDIRALEDRS